MRISDWSSDVCSSDLGRSGQDARLLAQGRAARDQQRGTGRVPLAGRPLGLCVGGRRVMARRAVLGLFASAAALLLCGCERTDTLRYRMTVEVEPPTGVRSGSSVIETTIPKGPRTGQGHGLTPHSKGEAGEVDPGNEMRRTA